MINIVEVGPRDGLQNEKSIISTADKFEFIRLLSETGLKKIEATSFVKAEAIPQMGDAKELFELLQGLPKKNLTYSALVPNLVGLEQAISSQVKEIAVFTACSDSFSKKNINCTVDESMSKIEAVMIKAQAHQMSVRGYISTAFGCPYEGKVSLKRIIEIAEKLIQLGAYEISIGDTIGVATPKEVKTLVETLKQSVPLSKIAMHFHDTRGMALTNIYQSLELGIETYDASAAGLGGCPYAKGATGNVATEDVLHLMEVQGLRTGVDLPKLVTASRFILGKLQKQTESKFLKTLLEE